VTYAVFKSFVTMSFWFAGYVLTWIAKWTLAASVLGIEPVIENILWSMGGDGYRALTWAPKLHFLEPTWIVVSRGTSHLLGLIALSWGIAVAVLVWDAAFRRFTKRRLIDFAVLQLPNLIPIAWVEILRTVSMQHVGFVYLDFLPFAITPLLAFGVIEFRPPQWPKVGTNGVP
jgi:hypothetical protein